jgi:hypothetical protein
MRYKKQKTAELFVPPHSIMSKVLFGQVGQHWQQGVKHWLGVKGDASLFFWS